MSEPPHADNASDGRPPTAEQSGGYERVRDSWVDGTHPAHGEESFPPPLPVSLRELPVARSPADEAFVDRMLERLAAGDYVGALMAAEALLVRLPADADALDCAEMSRTELCKLYVARLGSLDRIPTIAMSPEQIVGQPLDIVAGFLLSRIDGLTSLREISITKGVSPSHSLRVLSELYLRGVITVHG
jgi:hypothetical protein